jgi:hypothetical protein
MLLLLILSGLAGFFVSTVSDLHAQEKCGVERWAVKTLSDADTIGVRFDSVISTTVTALTQLEKLKVGQSTTRQPEERVVYRVPGVLTHFKREEDRDLHLILKALDSDSTIVIEVPDPDCPEVIPTSRASQYASIIRWISDSVGNPTTKFKEANKTVTVTGVRYGDFWHNQRGMAHNCLELHPILSIQSAEPAAKVDVVNGVEPVLDLYPNPADGWLKIEVSWPVETTDLRIAVISSQGYEFLSQTIQTVKGKAGMEIDLRGWGNGLYVVEVTSAEGRISKKLSIVK